MEESRGLLARHDVPTHRLLCSHEPAVPGTNDNLGLAVCQALDKHLLSAALHDSSDCHGHAGNECLVL